MKTEGQIRHKLKQVTYRHRKKRIRTQLSRRPMNCYHNCVVSKTSSHEIYGCSHPKREGIVCDSYYGGDLIASECPFFQPSKSKEEIREEFDHFIQTASLPEIATEMPDVTALMWALEEESDVLSTEYSSDDSDDASEDQEDDPSEVLELPEEEAVELRVSSRPTIWDRISRFIVQFRWWLTTGRWESIE